LNRERAPLWTAAELGRFLIAPDAVERLSPVLGPGSLILDLDATSEAEARHWRAALVEPLAWLPCVTIAIDGTSEGPNDADSDPAKRAIANACDVVLPSRGELDPLLAGFAATPIAALAFVQLLRASGSGSVHAGLVAESFAYSVLQSGPEFRRSLEARSPKVRKLSAEDGPACHAMREGDRLEIRLARPAVHNAFSAGMRDALVESLQVALADPSIEEIVLRGNGPSFCSGGDLSEFGSFPDPATAHAIRTSRSPARLVHQLAERMRCEVHGACIGAGIELPAFGRRIVAREDAFFRLPEVGLGLVPGAGGTVSLPRRIGRQRTAWLGLSGVRIDARTALAWGLVDEVRLGQHVPTKRKAQSER
jgi:enoyl-CoA hydratase/carnithine racemase